MRLGPREEHVADDVFDALLAEAQLLRAHHGRVDEVEPQRVGAVGVDDELRVRVVFEALAHLLAVGGEDEAVDNDVFEGGAVKERRRQHNERVEPAAGGRGGP